MRTEQELTTIADQLETVPINNSIGSMFGFGDYAENEILWLAAELRRRGDYPKRTKMLDALLTNRTEQRLAEEMTPALDPKLWDLEDEEQRQGYLDFLGRYKKLFESCYGPVPKSNC